MRRVIAVVAALALAGIGTFFLVRYVQSAEDRALEGEVLVDVLVVTKPVDAGTFAEELELGDQVTREQVPTKVAAAGAVNDLDMLTGRVAAIDLLPGEQLVAARFITPEAYQESLGGAPAVEVPENLLQVTLSLQPERVVGGNLKPGDRVAVFASFDPFQLGGIEPTGLEDDEIPVFVPTLPEGEEPQQLSGLQTPNSTKIILHQVLVTNLQAGEVPEELTEEEQAAGAPDLAPTRNLLITLALEPVDAERLVFTAEHGWVWLALEGAEVDEADTEVQTRRTVYEAQ